MATVVTETLNETPAPRGKYPWHEWTDGRTWQAKQGEDFQCSQSGFLAQIHQRAKNHGMRAVTTSKGNVVRFRFVLKTESASPPSGPEAEADDRD